MLTKTFLSRFLFTVARSFWIFTVTDR